MSQLTSSVALRILIADHQPLVRSAVRVLLETKAGFEIVAETSTGEETLQLVAATRPHVAIVDVAMPQMAGIEVTKRIRDSCPATRVLALTASEAEKYVRPALLAGAAGYVPKSAEADELIEAVRVVASGKDYVHPLIVRTLNGATPSPSLHIGELTAREFEVVRLVALGYSHKEIAAQIRVSVKTVETHKGRAIQKLGVSSRVDFVRIAAQQGWIDEQKPA